MHPGCSMVHPYTFLFHPVYPYTTQNSPYMASSLQRGTQYNPKTYPNAIVHSYYGTHRKSPSKFGNSRITHLYISIYIYIYMYLPLSLSLSGLALISSIYLPSIPSLLAQVRDIGGSQTQLQAEPLPPGSRT